MLDACGPSSESGEKPQNAGCCNVFEELRRANRRREGKETAAPVGRPLWADGLDPDAQLEAEAQVRKLEEELRIEQDVQCPRLC